jgi:hypothetical protein
VNGLIDVTPADRDLLSHASARGEWEEQDRSLPFVADGRHRQIRFLGPVPLPLRIVDLHLGSRGIAVRYPHSTAEERIVFSVVRMLRIVLQAPCLAVSFPRGSELLFFPLGAA